MLTLGGVACGDSGMAPGNPGVATVEVTLAQDAIEVGQFDTATAIARDADGHQLTVDNVSWLSTFPGVASVFSNGQIDGINQGNSDIVATIDGPTGSPVALAGWEIRPSDTGPTTYVIPAGVTIAAGGFAVFDEASLSFPLPVNGQLVLLRKFRRLSYHFAWIDQTR